MAGMSRLASSGCGTRVPSMDRLSSLPCDVLDQILVKLPITDAVRTCVLAKDWRYKWLSLSEFCFDSDRFGVFLNNGEHKWGAIASMVNNFLLNHSGKIKKISIRTYCAAHCSEVYQWIHFLSKQDIQTFVLEEASEELFKIPTHLFSFEKLTGLLLASCTLQVPCTFGSFNSLWELTLRNVSITDEALERLIIGCPTLQMLTLWNIRELEHLKIHAPMLRWLSIDFGFGQLSIENAPRLSGVTIDTPMREGMIVNWRSIIHSLSGLPSLSYLALCGGLIKLLATDYGLEGCPFRFYHLTSLYIQCLRFEEVNEFRVCLALLRLCPNLQVFGFTVKSAKGPRIISGFFKENRGRFSSPQLTSVNMVCKSSMGSALDFLEFVSLHAPKLKEITIMKEGYTDFSYGRIRTTTSRLRKSCPRASVRFVPVGPTGLI